MARIDEGFWPASLQHLATQNKALSDRVVVGYVSSEPTAGYAGFLRLHTALIPVAEVDAVLRTPLAASGRRCAELGVLSNAAPGTGISGRFLGGWLKARASCRTPAAYARNRSNDRPRLALAEGVDRLATGLLLGDQLAPILVLFVGHPSRLPSLQFPWEGWFTRCLRWARPTSPRYAVYLHHTPVLFVSSPAPLAASTGVKQSCAYGSIASR